MKRLILLFLSALLLAAGSGCSKRVPDPPMIRSELVLSLLYALDRKEYADAAVKVTTLQSIDSTNIFLSELHSIVISNLSIQGAGRLLEQGKRAEAEQLIHTAVLREGNSPVLAAAEQDIRMLGKMEDAMKIVLNPPNSDALTNAVRNFNEAAEQLKAPASLVQKVNDRLKQVPVMRAREAFLEENSIRILENGESESYDQTLQAILRLKTEQKH